MTSKPDGDGVQRPGVSLVRPWASWADCGDRVCRVLSDHGLEDAPYWAKQFLAGHLYNMRTGVDPATAARRGHEHHKKLSSIRDKTAALLRDLKDLDAFDRSENAACGLDANGNPFPLTPFGGEHAAAVIPELAKLQDVLSDLTAVPPDPPQRGRPQELHGYVSIGMYDVLKRAGVTDLRRCSRIIVDILDGNAGDKKKSVEAMWDRLRRIHNSDK